jgi:hypothetical protein
MSSVNDPLPQLEIHLVISNQRELQSDRQRNATFPAPPKKMRQVLPTILSLKMLLLGSQ